jgi:hypothetical protein
MRNSLTKLHYLLFVLLLLAMTGCGANKAGTSAGTTSSQLGGISAKLQWQQAGSAKRALAAVAPAGVTNLLFTVSGSGSNGAIPVVKANVAASTGQGQVGGIYPGTVAVTVKAVDSTGNTLYEGFATSVVVTAGSTTDVGTITMSTPIVKAQEVPCLGCHETALDATGQNIVANYKSGSGHYTNTAFTDANGQGAGCVGCHGPSHNTPNPFDTGRCFECHQDKVTLHSNSSTDPARAAMYMSTNEKCTSCHQPHNTKLAEAERYAWAKSAHGDVNGAAWSSEDMQQPGQTACQRCHTATGFKNFAISNFKTFPTASIGTADDTKREVLGCDGCHTDNTFKVRQVGPFTSQYKINNNTVTAAFPDAGESNLCIACHSARENGVDGVTDFTNASFKNSHYLAAAGIMYMSTGFTQFTSASAAYGTSTYGKSLSPDSTTVPGFGIAGGVSSTHRKLGTANIVGDHGIVSGLLDKNGPCVTCHMNGSGTGATRAAHGHTLAIDSNAYNQVCINCHKAENTVPLSADNFKANFVEPNSEAFQNTLKLASTLLSNRGIDYNPNAYPYFYVHGTTSPVKDWTLGTGNQTFGKKMMGACFNMNLLTKDPAAFAHGRTYSRRLLYDSIDFLDDGVINGSVGATALASGLVDANGSAIFTKGAQAYNAASGSITTIYSGTSEATLYLLGWSRSTGAWSTPERP